MNVRYQLLADLGSVPGETLAADTLPAWLSWDSYTGAAGYAEITGTAPSQDIDYDYSFTVRAYDNMNFDVADTDTYNDRDYEINVLADATCVSPVNNVCT